jgi:D-arabinose 1-dehydrogenase-like Zn-dependent alcohol dehydrogenase
MCGYHRLFAAWSLCGVITGPKVAILGMGGLGHIAVKLAKALGAEVTVITTSPDISGVRRPFLLLLMRLETAKNYGKS